MYRRSPKGVKEESVRVYRRSQEVFTPHESKRVYNTELVSEGLRMYNTGGVMELTRKKNSSIFFLFL